MMSVTQPEFRPELMAKLDTDEEENSCLCFSRNEILLTGHESKFKVWTRAGGKYEWILTHVVDIPEKGCVTCITQYPSTEEKYAVSFNNCLAIYNVFNRPQLVHIFHFNTDEINQIDINARASFICACDDSGDIKVIDVQNLCLYKSLSRQHDNICSTVKFNRRKPWEIFSGGLDCQLIRWDFSRGRPLVAVDVQMSERGDEVKVHTKPTVESYMVNPPMVHSLDVFSSIHSLACGLGNGSVFVYSALSPKKLEVICSAPLHSASVAHVCCMEISEQESKYYIISGGNDGRICISRLEYERRAVRQVKKHHSKEHQALGELHLIATIKHGSKINWIVVSNKNDKLLKPTASLMSSHTLVIIAADQTRQLTVYEVKCDS
jgi:WD40 repeat protein